MQRYGNCSSNCLFHKAPPVHTKCTRHLEMYLDEKLNFNYHIRKKIAKGEKVSKGAAVL